MCAPSSHSWQHIHWTWGPASPSQELQTSSNPAFKCCCDHGWTHPSHHTPWERIPHSAAQNPRLAHTTVLKLLQESLRGPANPGRTWYSLPSPKPLPSSPQPRARKHYGPLPQTCKLAAGKERIYEANLCKPHYYYKWTTNSLILRNYLVKNIPNLIYWQNYNHNHAADKTWKWWHNASYSLTYEDLVARKARVLLLPLFVIHIGHIIPTRNANI